MIQVRTLESWDAPELQPYLTLARPQEHDAQGLFVAEGEKIVRRLLASRFGIVSLLLTPEWHAELAPALAARADEDMIVFHAPKPELEKLTGFRLYQGALAVGRIPSLPPLHEVLSRAQNPRFLVAVDGINNPDNLGLIIRNAAAFATHGLVVGDRCCHPFLRRSVRNSMGTIFSVPVTLQPDLAGAVRAMKAAGIRCIAAHAAHRGRTIYDVDLRGDACIILGNEQRGISEDVLQCCSDAVAIPMPSHIDSLNVASASAVFFYELHRQREATRPRVIGTAHSG